MNGKNMLGAMEAHVSDASARAIAVWSAHLAPLRLWMNMMRIRMGDSVLFSHDSAEDGVGTARCG